MKAKSSCERYKRFARRDFLRSAALTASALALPAILPARVKDADVAPPSGRITLGAIGIGGMGTLDLTSLLGQSDVQVLAVCDVKEKNLQRAAEMVNRQYQNQDCARYHDWREFRGPSFRLRSGPFRNKPLASKASEAYRRRVRVSRRIPDPNSLLPQAGWRGCQTHSALNYPRRSNVALESARPLANGFEFPRPVGSS